MQVTTSSEVVSAGAAAAAGVGDYFGTPVAVDASGSVAFIVMFGTTLDPSATIELQYRPDDVTAWSRFASIALNLGFNNLIWLVEVERPRLSVEPVAPEFRIDVVDRAVSQVELLGVVALRYNYGDSKDVGQFGVKSFLNAPDVTVDGNEVSPLP